MVQVFDSTLNRHWHLFCRAYASDMQSDDLSPAQRRRLLEALNPMLGYLYKLRRRMQNKSFPLDDKLWVLVTETTATMQTLVTEVRCQSAQSNPNKTGPSTK